MNAKTLFVTLLTGVPMLLAAPAQAETKRIQLSPRPVAVVSETKLKPGDDPAHELVQQVRTDRVVSSSDPEFQGAEVTVYSHTDVTKGNGTYRGMAIVRTTAGHAIYDHFDGRISTTLRADGRPVTRFQGTHRLEGGTGKFANARGAGVHSGKAEPDGGFEMDSVWSLDY